MLCILLRNYVSLMGGRLGLQPQTLPEGIIPSDSLLPLRGGFKNWFGIRGFTDFGGQAGVSARFRLAKTG